MSTAAKPEPGTAVAVNEARPYALKSPIAELLQSEKALAIIGPMVPHGVDYRQVISEVYRAATKDAKILKCTPTSIIDAVSTVVQTGLVVGKTIYLVPQRTKISQRGEPDQYEERLQAWTHYVGDIELVVRSGAARHVVGEAVYAGDQFDVRLGMDPNINHVPSIDPAKRGALIGAYSIAYLNSAWTQRKVTWVPLADVEKVRKSSKSWSPEKVKECPDWYAIKTAIRRNCKTLPKNEKLAKVLAIFEREEASDRGEEIESTAYTLSPALPREPHPRQLMPATATENPYDLDASGGEQVRDVPAETPAPRTAGQRAAAEEAAKGEDPYAPTMPFKQGAAAKDSPISKASDKDLADAIRFASDVPKYAEFVTAAEDELERRRIADDESEG